MNGKFTYTYHETQLIHVGQIYTIPWMVWDISFPGFFLLTDYFLFWWGGLAWPSLARNGLENACQAPNPLGDGYAPGAFSELLWIDPGSMKNRGFSKRHGFLNFGFFGCRMGKGHERTPKQMRSMSNFLELLTRQARSESHPKPAKTKGG